MIVYNGVVLKCGGNSTYGYNAQTGELLYKYDCFGSYPTFYDDNMYIMGLPNYLYCYSVDKMER
ncbi:MAG: hypothetical protein E7123_05520 [Bacteroidales bacterium]|nr:hypothetical protein [Bacteroidales bacterium]